MPKVKLYASKAWLTRKYVTEKRSEKEIAELAGTTVMTINRYLHQYGLKKDR